MTKSKTRRKIKNRPETCKNANRYQGKRRPRCNGGVGCIRCYEKWIANGGEWLLGKGYYGPWPTGDD